jgi:hypothetical protein
MDERKDLAAIAATFEGIRDQDGWETLELMVRHDHPTDADAILAVLAI